MTIGMRLRGGSSARADVAARASIMAFQWPLASRLAAVVCLAALIVLPKTNSFSVGPTAASLWQRGVWAGLRARGRRTIKTVPRMQRVRCHVLGCRRDARGVCVRRKPLSAAKNAGGACASTQIPPSAALTPAPPLHTRAPVCGKRSGAIRGGAIAARLDSICDATPCDEPLITNRVGRLDVARRRKQA